MNLRSSLSLSTKNKGCLHRYMHVHGIRSTRHTQIVTLVIAALGNSVVGAFRIPMKRSSARLATRDRQAIRCVSSNATLDPMVFLPDIVVSGKRQRQVTTPVTTRFATPSSASLQAATVVSPSPEDDARTATESAAAGKLPVTRSLFQRDDGFVDLQVPPDELRPSATLTTGQCFHWKVVVPTSEVPPPAGTTERSTTPKSSAWGTHNATEWVGTLRVSTGEALVILLRETPDSVFYRTLYAPQSLNVRSFLYSYFQLPDTTLPERVTSSSSSLERLSLRDLYHEWSTQCDRLRRIAECIPGVRIIDQDPWECLVSFLCSSNNNIPRITKMLAAIRHYYGEPIVHVTTACLGHGKQIADTENGMDSVQLYSFPSLIQLSHATEADLRLHCGMGYRAKYLVATIKTLIELGGESYLHELRAIDDPIVVQEKLLQFTGVGRKVADCVALFSLQSVHAVPVDVHVWNIARRDYGADAVIVTKSLTPTIYRQVGDLFRSRFPTRSGWAHSLLFVAELPSFRSALPTDMVEEMDRFRAQEKTRKASQRKEAKS